jgi:transketolase
MGTATLERGRAVTSAELNWRADWIRLQAVHLIDQAGLGHYSSTFSCAKIFAALYYHTLRLRPAEPQWPDRDRFLLGKGHVATGLWPVLADLGYYPAEWLKQFGKIGSPLNDHPNMRLAPGIDFSSGSLGHNLSVATGIAYGGRLSGRDYRTGRPSSTKDRSTSGSARARGRSTRSRRASSSAAGSGCAPEPTSA